VSEDFVEINDRKTEKITRQIPGGMETILVVEDNSNVRRFAVRSLQKLGYQVLETENSDTAMEIISDDEQSIDLLFSDIIIPGDKNGHELALWSKQFNPKLKVLLTTGLRDGTIDEQSISGDGLALLRKPYSLEILAQYIRSQLEDNIIQN